MLGDRKQLESSTRFYAWKETQPDPLCELGCACVGAGEPAFVWGALVHSLIFCSELFSSRLLRHGGVLQGVLWVGDGATAELRGRCQPLLRLSTWGGMQSPLKLPGGLPFTSAGFGISLSLREPFRSDVQITSSKH